MSKVMESMSTDMIMTLSDEEIRRKLKHLHGAIQAARRNSKDATTFEVEYCYFIREQEVRDQRHQAHAKFLAEKAQRRGSRFNGRPREGGFRNREHRGGHDRHSTK